MFKDNYAIKRLITKLLAISIQFDKANLSSEITASYSPNDWHFHIWRMKNIFALHYLYFLVVHQAFLEINYLPSGLILYLLKERGREKKL